MTNPIRPATLADVPAMMAMYDHSRTIMRSHGNTAQWVGYPTEEVIRTDIALGASYMVADEGCFALVNGTEPTYAVIKDGRWIEPDRPYSTLHRLACAPHGHGVAMRALRFAAAQCNYLRADTHPSNHIMRRILEGFGFVECGTIYVSDGSPRVAYEWWRYDEVDAALRQFVEDEVLPQYQHFDAAHRVGHARRVIARAMAMVHQQGGDPNLLQMAYTAAAMHDVGLAFGREEHHLHSGRMVRQCQRLRQWFDSEQVEQIACAVEDHRASATRPPRSLLGCIVAEADRDVEPHTILQRTVQYSLSHYPQYTFEQHLERCMAHLDEKYSYNGYIRLWLDPSPNEQPLAELRSIIEERKMLEVTLTAMIVTQTVNNLRHK